MALESATHVSDLVSSNPAGRDIVAEGDNHIRLLKSVLQTTFPTADEPLRLANNKVLVSQSSPLTLNASHEGYTVIATAGGTAEQSIVLPTNDQAPEGYRSPCLLYTSPSPRDRQKSRMPSSA